MPALPAPSVMEFDSNGKLLRAWGGPADADKCKAADGCVWPATEHGIFVDHNGYVYLGGNNANANPNGSAWASNNGADGMILKFTKDGKFVMMIGGPGGKGPDSNNKNGGRNGTPLFYLPADITVDPRLSLVAAHEVTHRAEDALRAGVRRLTAVTVHASPAGAHPGPAVDPVRVG